MKKIIYLLIILILVAGAFAVSETQEEDTSDLCRYIIQKANIPVGTKIPGIFMQYKNDRFNVYTHEGNAIGHLTLSNGYVAEFNCQSIDNPTYDVIIKDKETVDYVLNSEKRIKALSEKINNKEITINGINFGKDVKSFITKVGINIAAVFM